MKRGRGIPCAARSPLRGAPRATLRGATAQGGAVPSAGRCDPAAGCRRRIARACFTHPGARSRCCADTTGSAGSYFLAVASSLACGRFLAIRCGFFFFPTVLYNGSLARILFWATFLASPLKAAILITVKTIRSSSGNHFFTNSTSLAYSPKLISQGRKTSAQYPGQIFRQVTGEGMGCRAVSGQIAANMFLAAFGFLQCFLAVHAPKRCWLCQLSSSHSQNGYACLS